LRQGQELRDQFSALAALPDDRISLAEAALTVARAEYPDLDVSRYVQQLNDMAARVKSRIENITAPERRIDAMNHLLFDEEGFTGNRADYYDPRNSFLNDVIDRKLGIPITLSIVYIEVGRGAELPLYGIGFPGHFLTGLLTDKGRVFIDPFDGGKVLSEDDCRRMLRGRPGGSPAFNPSFLSPAWPKQILVRLLRNLKAVYWHLSQEMKAVWMTEWILILDPNAVPEIKERGFFYEAIGDVQGAVRDLQRYLELAPAAEDEELVKATIERLRGTKSTIH
jgi:regulator of sirC expression with transglutaminase-like and TPR domain